MLALTNPIHYFFAPIKYLIDHEGKMGCMIAKGKDTKLDEQLQELLK